MPRSSTKTFIAHGLLDPHRVMLALLAFCIVSGVSYPVYIYYNYRCAGLAESPFRDRGGWVVFSSDGMGRFRGPSELYAVRMNGTDLQDADLAELRGHLENLPSLSVLDLSGTDITDTGLTHLAALTRLDVIHLYETTVTLQGVTILQRALPKCEINWDGARRGC